MLKKKSQHSSIEASTEITSLKVKKYQSLYTSQESSVAKTQKKIDAQVGIRKRIWKITSHDVYIQAKKVQSQHIEEKYAQKML